MKILWSYEDKYTIGDVVLKYIKDSDYQSITSNTNNLNIFLTFKIKDNIESIAIEQF